MALTKNSKSLYEATISMFSMFIRVYDVAYVEMQLKHSKLSNFISS